MHNNYSEDFNRNTLYKYISKSCIKIFLIVSSNSEKKITLEVPVSQSLCVEANKYENKCPFYIYPTNI